MREGIEIEHVDTTIGESFSSEHASANHDMVIVQGRMLDGRMPLAFPARARGADTTDLSTDSRERAVWARSKLRADTSRAAGGADTPATEATATRAFGDGGMTAQERERERASNVL